MCPLTGAAEHVLEFSEQPNTADGRAGGDGDSDNDDDGDEMIMMMMTAIVKMRFESEYQVCAHNWTPCLGIYA